VGLEPDVRAGLQRVVVASIGPMTSEELRRQVVRVDFEASPDRLF
jgi:uroporphyrinogen-III synthase